MTDISKLYIFGDSPTSLAKKVIERNFEGKPIVFPIWCPDTSGISVRMFPKYENKLDYYDALSRADIKGDFTDLKNVFLREIMRSMIQLNSKFEI